MITTNIITEIEIVNQYCIIEQPQHVKEILELTDIEWYVRQYNLTRGKYIVRKVEVTVEIVKERCYKHGYNGQKQERVIIKSRKILSEKETKLWRTKKRGWYWVE